MAFCISIPSFSDSVTAPSLSQTYFSLSRRPSNFIHFLNLSLPIRPPCLCRASNSQPGPLPKQSASTSSKKRKKKGKGDTKVLILPTSKLWMILASMRLDPRAPLPIPVICRTTLRPCPNPQLGLC